MNSNFYINLKRVGYSKNKFPNAPFELENSYNELIETLKEHQLKNSDALSKFAIAAYNEITDTQKRIGEWHKGLWEKELSKMTSTELDQHQVELDYFLSILHIADDARGLLLEHLAVYKPDLFNDDKKLKLLKEFLPFSPVVKRIEKTSLTQQTSKIEFTTVNEKNNQLKPSEIESRLSEIKNTENKFWKGLPMEQVVKHFEVLTIKKSKNGNTFLTQEQLITFLEKGFLNNVNHPKQKINCASGEKGFVIKRFYEFFDLVTSRYSYPQKKEGFISLFTDCFENWEPETIFSFFKPNKTKKKW